MGEHIQLLKFIKKNWYLIKTIDRLHVFVLFHIQRGIELSYQVMINDFANKYRRKLLLVTTLKYLTANIFVSFMCSEFLHNISRGRSVEGTNKSVIKF